MNGVSVVEILIVWLQAKRMSKDEGVLKTKERIGEGVRAAKAKLGYVESRL